jgi:hypothetical protein
MMSNQKSRSFISYGNHIQTIGHKHRPGYPQLKGAAEEGKQYI